MAKTYWLRFGAGDPRTFTGLAPTFLIFSQANGSAVTPPSISENPASSGLYNFSWGTTTSIGFLVDAATTSPGPALRYVSGSIDPADRADEYGTTIVAIGTSNIALGTTSVSWGLTNNTALTNVGTTLVAIGNTSIAQGVLEIGLGTTTVAIGTTILASNVNQGVTLVAIGNTAITQANNIGTTLVAIGNTSIAYGGTILADIINMGSTLVAFGNSLAAIGTSFTVSLAEIGTTASSYGNSSTDPGDLFGYMKRILENLEGNQTYIKGTGALSIFARTGATLLTIKTITNSVTTVIKT